MKPWAWPLVAVTTLVGGAAVGAPRTPTWPTEVDRVATPLLAVQTPGEASDDSERIAAVRELTAFTTESIADTILLALDDPAMQVRREALGVCYLREIAACVPRAAQLWRDGRETTLRIAALRVVAMAPKGHAGLLRDALRDPAESIRAQAAQFLGWSPLQPDDRERARAALLAKLADLSAVVRRHVVDSLGLIGDGDAVLPIARLLDDPEPTVRAAAATALARLHDDRAVPPLRRALDDPNEPQVTKALVRAVAQVGDDEVEEDLLAMLDDPPQGLDTALVADAIGRRPEPGRTLVEGLVTRLREPAQRRAALDALQMLGERAHPQLRATAKRGLEPPLAVEVDRLLGKPGRSLPTTPSPPAATDVSGWYRRLHDGALDERLTSGAQLGALGPSWLAGAVEGHLHPRASLERHRGWLVALATTTAPVATESTAPWVRLAGWASDSGRALGDRCLAVAALSAAGSPRARAIAKRSIQDSASARSPTLRACAALAAARLGDGTTVAWTLADPAARVRTAAALGAAKGDLELSDDAVGRLQILAVADEAGEVRRAARLALRRRATRSVDAPSFVLVPAPEFPWVGPAPGIAARLEDDGREETLEVPAVTLRGLRLGWLPSLAPQWPLPDTL